MTKKTASQIVAMNGNGHPDVLIVGSGLAGSMAALAAAAGNPQCNILLLEKEHSTGGNSIKASSGINSLTPEYGDTPDIFKADIIRSGGGRSDVKLVDTLVSNSTAALAYLQSLGIELNGTVQLGGHTAKRTHFPSKGPNVGAAILSTLHSLIGSNPRIAVLTGAKVRKNRRSRKCFNFNIHYCE